MRDYKYIIFILALFFSVSMQGQYNPTNPAEPGAYYTLTLQADPSGGGSFNINTTTSYTAGTNINLRAYINSYYSFIAWELDGEVISTSTSFTYTMPSKNVKLIAHYKYNPDSPGEPPEPNLPVYSILNLSANPSSGGYFNISPGNKYQVGSSISLTAYANNNFVFKNWTENGEIISTSRSFSYVMEEGNPTLVANYEYSPNSPGEPDSPDRYYKLYLKANPASGGYFNVSSGNTYEVNSSVYLNAYSNQWYTFKNWTWGDSIVSTKNSFYFTIPNENVELTANYTYNYNPSNPNEPNEPGEDYVNIYGMTENGVRGQTITYPIYVENTSSLNGIVVDIKFPKGFVADVEQISLSGRVTDQEMVVTELGNNEYRFRLVGSQAIDNTNGKLFELPVTIPDTATMNYNYLVKFTHGVMHGADGSQLPIKVRSGYIYVERIMEDGLYAKFTIEKLKNRVKFINQSSNIATSFRWDFGDGTTSTETSPIHTFPSPGEYVVKLTANGQSDKDEAEMVVLINDESSWQVDGTFFLSDEEAGVRYFTSAESLFAFIGSTRIAGNIRVAVKSEKHFEIPLTATNVSSISNIQYALRTGGYTMAFGKFGTGRNPSLQFGSASASINKEFVTLFVKWGENMACSGVDMRLYGVSFNPSQIYLLNNQHIRSGENTKDVDFSLISPDIKFTWTLDNPPQKVYGYMISGERLIPKMTLVNESEQLCNLVYHVTGTYDSNTFCTFDHVITVTPALVGLFTKLSPADGTVTESTTITLSWSSIANAVYDVYLWNAVNERPSTPVVTATDQLQYVSKNFCQYGNSYKWQVIAKNDGQELASDTLSFSVNNLPDLHVYALECSEAVAENKFTVEWTVKNDGIGPTGSIEWKDYIWLLQDVFGGTSVRGSTLLASVPNVKALDSGESYNNSIDITLPDRTYGNYYIVVATDMYSITDIQWSAIGGSVINPYNPTQDGTSYKHLYATTSASNNMVYEQGETSTLSDNFFYKKIEIAVPDLADLQVPKIRVVADNDVKLASLAQPNVPVIGPVPGASRVSGFMGGDPGGFLGGNKLVPGYLNANAIGYLNGKSIYPSPLVVANLDGDTLICPGKDIKVIATIANTGGTDIKDTRVRHVLYLSNGEDPMNADYPLKTLESLDDTLNLKAGESKEVTFKARLPYELSGDTYLHVYADISDAVYELANTFNNWGTYQVAEMVVTPGADFVPQNLHVSNTISPTSNIDVSYQVVNKGYGVPFKNTWQDKVYLSKKNTGIDNTATQIGSVSNTGQFYLPLSETSVEEDTIIHLGEEYKYKGDNYTKTISVKPRNLTTGTYYIYVMVDADKDVHEPEGEDNNVLMAGPIKFVQPDLTAEIVSVSEDTLSTGNVVSIAWKVKNTGTGNLQDSKLTDKIYATVNQDGTGGVLLATVENDVWITAGSEKTLRANVTIPSVAQLDGLRYIYVVTNADGQIVEENTSNNSSNSHKTWFAYTVEPSVKDMNLKVTELNVPRTMKPGETVQLLYTAKNTGGMTLTTSAIPQEVFLTTSSSFSLDKATKCEIISSVGTPSGLPPGKSERISVKFLVPDNIVGGNKFLFFYVDRTNSLGEKNITDNYDIASVFINGNLPDWKPQDYSLVDTLLTSVDTPLTFTMANDGDWDAKASLTDIYLSGDNQLDRSDLRLATINTPAIGKDKLIQQQYNLNIADKYPGNWYILIKANAEEKQVELDQTNNILAIPVTIVQSPLPDLVSTEVAFDDILKAGNKVKVKSKVVNQGDFATRNNKWTDTYYLSTSAVLNVDEAIMLGSKIHVGILQVGQDYTNEITLNIPSTAQGNYMLFVVSDATDIITEGNENNNRKFIPVYVNGSKDMQADLTVTNVTAPSSIKAGESTTLTYKITNLGEYPAEGLLNDVIYLSKDNKWDVDDEMVGTASGNVNIEAGQTITRSISGHIINMPEGEYYLIIKTNATNSIADENEENNLAVMASPSRLTFQNITLGSTTTVNTSGYFKLNVPNGFEGKTIGFYLEHPSEAQAGLYGAFESVPSTANYLVGASRLLETQQEILIPNVKQGNYYILAQDNATLVNAIGNQFVIDGNAEVPKTTQMSLTAKEIPFGATTLSISEGGNKGWVSTDINGALFDSIMDFRLRMDNQAVPAEAIRYNGMTSSRVTFNLNNAKTGSYDVVSELPNGTQAILPNGFKVIPGTKFDLNVLVEAPGAVRWESLIPFSISYANGGNTDCVIYDLILSVEGGTLGTSIKDLERNQTVLHIPLSENTDIRGYTSIPPGEQKVINLFMLMASRTATITVYVVY